MRTTLLFIFFASFLHAQEAKLLMDINPGSDGSFEFSLDRPYLEYKDKLYFSAKNEEFGLELWVYDGQNVSLLKDINPGPTGSDVQNLYILNDKLMFIADDGTHGDEWWISDGTSTGTEILVDLLPGEDGGAINCCNSDALQSIIVYKDELYFNSNIGSFHRRLYKTDGTAEGTVELARLNANQRSAENFTIFNDLLYFDVVFEGFWVTDGTTDGTVMLVEEDHEGNHFDPKYILNMGDYMIMVNGADWDLWRSDGTTAGTTLIKELVNAGAQNNQGKFFIDYKGIALFVGAEQIDDGELWRSDGTESGTYEVINLGDNEAFIPLVPRKKVLFKDLVYYIGGTNDTGFQLYKTDGTLGGTEEISKIDEWENGQVYFQSDLVATDNFIFFTAGRAFNRQLWVSDGTTNGTREIVVNQNGEATPERFILFKDKLIFFANGDGVGYEPHYVDVNTLSSTSEEDAEFTINIFPNPANSQIQIDTQLPIRTYYVYDLMGNMLLKSKDSNWIYVGDLKDGMYLLELEAQNGKRISKKFFIKK